MSNLNVIKLWKLFIVVLVTTMKLTKSRLICDVFNKAAIWICTEEKQTQNNENYIVDNEV